MGAFLEAEKQRLSTWKAATPCLSKNARADGVYKRRPRSFCLPVEHAEENLFAEVRNPAISYFFAKSIKWHDGQGDKPSNHLCDSQVCCVNFLFPFADKPEELSSLLRPMFPSIRQMLPIEDSHYVAMEWIGEKNYLGEGKGTQKRRTRGANFTSADAAVMFQRWDGSRQIVLIEWKYTESYPSTSIRIAEKSGTDRTRIYRPLFDRDDCPMNKKLVPAFDALFYEPFYQFMRQQFLAHEMERAHELDADTVSLLHIAPTQNLDFKRVTSPNLQSLGSSPTAIWKGLVGKPEAFRSISTEEMFGRFPITQFSALQEWWAYIATRYPWITAEE